MEKKMKEERKIQENKDKRKRESDNERNMKEREIWKK